LKYDLLDGSATFHLGYAVTDQLKLGCPIERHTAGVQEMDHVILGNTS